MGHSQTNSYLQENIDSMLKWLVEKRFIRRTNVGEQEESWNDEIPSWVSAAQSASGVSMVKKKSTEPVEATFGFKKASSN